ncbi:MAG: glutathione S-transferase family protein [Parvibaculaceae bacterium]
MSAEVTLFGARYSVYVRAVLMALEAKGVGYALEPVDIFSAGADLDAYRRLHPFLRIPALRHGDFVLYETAAINRYVDEAFVGPALQPVQAESRARMTQIMSMTDSYAYRPLVWDVYVERVGNPSKGKATDEARVAAALPRARTYLQALHHLMGRQAFLADEFPTLADFHAAPVFGYFLATGEGRDLVSGFPRVARWWERISATAAWKRAVGT